MHERNLAEAPALLLPIQRGLPQGRRGKAILRVSHPLLLSFSCGTRTSWNSADICWEAAVCQALGWDLGTLEEVDVSPALEEPTGYLGRQSPEHKWQAQSGHRYRVHRDPSVNE